MKFDNIVGNPPFQGKGTSLGQSHLYPSFITRSISLLNKGGNLCFITPPTFLKGKIEILSEVGVEYINTHCGDYFPEIGTSFIWYNITNSPDPIETIIDGVDGSYLSNLRNSNLIPVGHFSKFSDDIINKIYGINSTLRFDFKRDVTPPPENAVFVRRMNRNESFCPRIIDDQFDLKLNQDYTSLHHSERKFDLLKSKLFSFLYLCYSTSPFITFGFINNIPLPSVHLTTDFEIYEYYGITDEEIQYIENNVK